MPADASGRNDSEDRFGQSEKQLREIIDNFPSCVKLVARDGTLLSMNPAGLRMVEAGEPRDVIGKSVYSLLAPQDLRKYKDFNERICDGESGVLEFRIIGLRGTRRWMETRAAPHVMESGGQRVQLSISHDITDRKTMEETLHLLADHGSHDVQKDLFQPLSGHLAQALQSDFIRISQLSEDHLSARPLCVRIDGEIRENAEYPLQDTPCREMIGSEIRVFPSGLSRLFPKDRMLAEFGAESYIGVSLWDSAGRQIGFIASISRRPITNVKRAESILKMVSIRASAEMERLRDHRLLRNSEEKFSIAFEHSAIGMALVSPEGRCLKANASLCRSLGYSKSELAGMNFQQLTHPEDLPDTLSRVNGVLAGESPGFQMEKRYLTRDGRALWAWVTATLIASADPPWKYFMLQVIDITERKAAEQSLRESERRISGIIDSAMDAIITINESHRILVFNRAAETMFGWPADQIIGQPLSRLLPQRFHAAHSEQIRSFGAAGATTRIMGLSSEVLGVRADGEEFPVEASISQIQVRDQKLYTVIMRDVSIRRKLERESIQNWMQLQDANASLSRKNAALREVLAAVEAEKSEVGMNVLANIEKIIFPSLAGLRQRLPRGEIRTLERIEADLKEIASPFVNKLSHSVSKLSPAEVRIASLIRRGLSVKQIAGLETISPQTVAAHRRSIRRKLAITHSKVNLATYLDINFGNAQKPPDDPVRLAGVPSAKSASKTGDSTTTALDRPGGARARQ